LTAAVDATPRLTWEGSEVRRYRDKLYAFTPLKEVDIDQPILWDLKQPLELDSMGTLEIVEGVGEGVARKHVKNNILTVDFRKGGEAIQPVGRKEKHALKKLFQESGVPPWIRERIPLIYIEGELAVVGGMFVSQKFHAQDSEDSYIFQWKSKQLGGSA